MAQNQAPAQFVALMAGLYVKTDSKATKGEDSKQRCRAVVGKGEKAQWFTLLTREALSKGDYVEVQGNVIVDLKKTREGAITAADLTILAYDDFGKVTGYTPAAEIPDTREAAAEPAAAPAAKPAAGRAPARMPSRAR